MSSEWAWKRLGDHCSKIGSGSTPKGGKDSYLASGPFTLIRSQNIYNEGFSPGGLAFISDEQAKKLDGVAIEDKDILLNITGDSVARVCLAPTKYLPARVNQHVAIIRPEASTFDNRFVRYFLASPIQQDLMLGLASAGATRNALTKVMIEDFKVPCPPLHIQNEIADVLSALDDRIALLRETNATLEAIAQAMFKSWFVDFDPVHANATLPSPRGRGAGGEGNNASRHPHPSPLPAGEGVQSMSVAIPARGTPVCAPGVPPDPSAAAALFPDSFEESEMGLVPRGWKVEPLTEVFDFREGPGIRNWQYTNTDQGTRFINIRCIQDGDLSIDTANRITDEEANGKYAHFHLRAWDVVVSTSGTLGRSAIVRQEHLPLMLNTSVIRFQPIQEKMRFSFVYEYLNSTEFLFKLESMASGSVQKNFGPMHLKQMKLVCPPIDLLAHYDAICRPLFEKVVANRARIQTLATLRDTLLPRLISGQLRLPEAEALLEELA